jgi:hypothetical protein
MMAQPAKQPRSKKTDADESLSLDQLDIQI